MTTLATQAQAAGSAGVPCLFVVGPPRSGTTMLRLLLTSHPEVCIPSPEEIAAAVEAARVSRYAEAYSAFMSLVAERQSLKWDHFGVEYESGWHSLPQHRGLHN